MHRLYVPPAQLAGAKRIKLTPAQSRYLMVVLRLPAGAPVEVFDGSGGRFEAAVAGGELEIRESLPVDARPVDVVLVQSLAKGEKMDVVVQKATELGATRIVPLASERAVVRLAAERGAARVERWRRIAQEAARQCGRAEVPGVDPPAGWEAVFALASEDRRALLLDPEQRELRLGPASRGVSRLLLVVGPEGGFSPAETARAEENGVLRVSLGPLVLRTETAGLAALAIVQHVHGALG